jgi:hypothetical protein
MKKKLCLKVENLENIMTYFGIVISLSYDVMSFDAVI